MKVSRERLSVIGRMIGIYREERRGNSQNNWTQIKFCDNICSPNTLKNIESGGIARSQELYEKLLEKLDLKLGEFPVIDEAVEVLIDKLYIAIEYYDNKSIEILTVKGLKVLETVKNYIYYSELYMFFYEIKEYYLNYVIIDDKKVERYTELLLFYGQKMKDILILMMLARIKLKGINDFEQYENFINELNLKQNNFVVIKLNILHYYYVSKQRFTMMEEIEKVEKQLMDSDNIMRLVDVYSFAIVMLSDVDESKSMLYIEKANHLIGLNVLSSRKTADLISNIASYYYNKKNFKEALEYLRKAVNKDCTDRLTNYIVMADCQNHVEQKFTVPKLDKRELKKYPEDLRITYQYFYTAQDNSLPAFVRIKMIMKHIVPILNDQILINIFRYELSKLVEQTNSYKTLYLFEKEIENKYSN